VAFLRQVEVAPGGFEVGLAHVPLNSAEVDASCAQRGGIGMAERMDANVSVADARPLGRFAERALDATAAHGSGRGGQVLGIASRGGTAPGGIAMGFPVDAQELPGGMRHRDRAILGALTPGDVDHGARAIDIAHLQGQRFVQA
jgi:hypothetical protein